MGGRKGVVLSSLNGGSFWLPARVKTSPRLVTVYFADENTGWAGGSNGLVVRSDDGGLGWRRLTEGGRDGLADIFFLDRSPGWAVGAHGKILATKSGGKNLTVRPSGTTRHPEGSTCS